MRVRFRLTTVASKDARKRIDASPGPRVLLGTVWDNLYVGLLPVGVVFLVGMAFIDRELGGHLLLSIGSVFFVPCLIGGVYSATWGRRLEFCRERRRLIWGERRWGFWRETEGARGNDEGDGVWSGHGEIWVSLVKIQLRSGPRGRGRYVTYWLVVVHDARSSMAVTVSKVNSDAYDSALAVAQACGGKVRLCGSAKEVPPYGYGFEFELSRRHQR